MSLLPVFLILRHQQKIKYKLNGSKWKKNTDGKYYLFHWEKRNNKPRFQNFFYMILFFLRKFMSAEEKEKIKAERKRKRR